MALVLHFDSDGFTCPRFQCDLCHCLIDDAATALILWDHYPSSHPDSSTDYRIVCSVCEQQRDAVLYEQFPFSMELDTALAYLLHNSGMNPKALKWAQQKAAVLGVV